MKLADRSNTLLLVFSSHVYVYGAKQNFAALCRHQCITHNTMLEIEFITGGTLSDYYLQDLSRHQFLYMLIQKTNYERIPRQFGVYKFVDDCGELWGGRSIITN